tara:strand:+ start:880 stop:1671 length:792 start_codon:yes stop_codon:yes gene_type:complete
MLKMIIQSVIILLAIVFCFAGIYQFLSLFNKNCLVPNPESFLDTVYFSVVTISSLGYGDIKPVGVSRFVAGVEVLFGLGFIGFLVSKIVSIRQSELLDNLQTSDVVGKFDECIVDLRVAKENIADFRRDLIHSNDIDVSVFNLGFGNPFYQVVSSMNQILGYIEHVERNNQLSIIGERFDRAAHHIEETAGFVRRLCKYLDSRDVSWKTKRSKYYLEEFCEKIEKSRYIVGNRSKYVNEIYKGHVKYDDLICDIVSYIRNRIK